MRDLKGRISWLLKNRLNPWIFIEFCRSVLECTGIRFFILLITVFLGIKGILNAVTQRGLLPLLKELKHDASTLQRIDGLGGCTWGCRGLLGALSDVLPIFGYHKLYYMLLATLMGILGIFLLVLLPQDVLSDYVLLIVGTCVILYCLEIAVLEIMASGKCSEVVNAYSIGFEDVYPDTSKREINMSYTHGDKDVAIYNQDGMYQHNDSDELSAMENINITSTDVSTAYNYDIELSQSMFIENNLDMDTSHNTIRINNAISSPHDSIISTDSSHDSNDGLLINVHRHTPTQNDTAEKSLELQNSNTVDIAVNTLAVVPPKNKANNIIPFTCICASIGTLIGTSLVGPITDYYNSAKPLYLLSIPIAVLPLFMVVYHFLPEKKVSYKFIHYDELSKQKGLLIMSLLVAVAAVGIINITLFTASNAIIVPYCILIPIVLTICAFIFLPSIMARWNVFLLLWGIFNINISGALDYYYTADQDCVADGPHFDYTYYTTVIALMGTIAEWVGIYIYHTYIQKKWTFRQATWFSCLLRTLASGFDLIMVLRLHRKIGIPDKLFYLLGDGIIQRTCITLNYLPGLALIIQLCPKGMEVTSYALMDGMAHLGWNLTKYIGAFIIEYAEIRTIGVCDFSNLPIVICITQILLPCVMLPMSFFLVPNTPIQNVR